MHPFSELISYLEPYDTVILFRHLRPDYDCCGSQFGLANWLSKRFVDKTIICYGKDVLPYSEGFFPSAIDEVKPIHAVGLAVDSSTKNRIDGQEWYEQCELRLCIDHHPHSEPVGDHEWVDPTASSCAQLLAQGMYEWDHGKPLEKKTATYLYAGMISDSIRFSINTTSADTLALASYLLRSDLDVNAINNQVFALSLETYRFSQHLRNVAIDSHPGLIYARIACDEYQSFGISATQAKARVSIFGEIRGIRIWAVILEEEKGVYSASLRSHTVMLRDIAEHFGGGGHACACGIPALTEEQVQELIAWLKKRANETKV